MATVTPPKTTRCRPGLTLDKLANQESRRKVIVRLAEKSRVMEVAIDAVDAVDAAQNVPVAKAASKDRGRVLDGLPDDAPDCAHEGLESPATLTRLSALAVEANLAALAQSVPPKLQRQFAMIGEILAELSPGARLHFWTSGNGSLAGSTPMEALSAGHYAAVRTTARGYVER